MASRAHGDPITSPYQFYDSGPDNTGKRITGTVTFSGAWTGTNALTGGTVHRDNGCQWTKILIGDPTNPDHTINVGNLNGDRSFSAVQLAAVGLNTVADLSFNITASA